MNTKYLAALGAGPPFLFTSQEMPYPELSDGLQIVNHAQAILDSIPLIQMVQPGARVTVTIETVLDFGMHYLLTALDRTRNAGFRFEAVATPAARACPYISYICAAKATVHSTGCDQRRTNHVCLC